MIDVSFLIDFVSNLRYNESGEFDMNAYDFDKTIYKRDCSTDFFIYMIFSRPYLLLFFPWFLLIFALYGCKAISKKTTKQCLFFFVPWYKNINKIVDKFWEKHANGIKEWYARQRTEEDVIVSAGLSFILKPIMETLNIKYWIATNFDTRSGKIDGENCYGEQKIIEFSKLFDIRKMDAFYSDSLSDLPIMKKAKKAYLVDGDKITEIDAKKYN